MLKLKNVMLALFALSAFMVMPAFAQNAGCKNSKFIGSYTLTDTSLSDLWGDGTNVSHTVIFQLNLHSDGTADQYWTGFPDIMLSGGSGSAWIGSWKCRDDGVLVVTTIHANYVPTTDAKNHPTTVPKPPPVDLILDSHVRSTWLFSVTDADTLTRTQSRNRVYGVTEDPSDPNGGTLRNLNNNQFIYKRLVASDADLFLP